MAVPRDTLAFVRNRASYAKAVGAFVPGLTRKSFEKYGFSTATLLTDWTVIAGRDLASFTLPERLKWPRNVETFDETDVARRGRPGATLVLRVDGPRAIEVQYQSAQIIERINAHFGYRAISEIRFVQAPLPVRRDAPAPAPLPRSALSRPGSTPTPMPVAADAARSLASDASLLAALDRLQDNMNRAQRSRRV